MAGSLLIIDDSSTMRRIIKRTIRMSGIQFDETFEAESGEEGFAKLSERAVDVVLCDVNMQGMRGTEMVKKVRDELPSCAKTKIIMVTTESSAAFVAEALSSGADGYIGKPFTPEKFQEKLTPLL
ncbi:MAG: response regulator [Pontiellaceae bacterium]|nr:response regulator [Pontiellaceae bacterium]MBN2785801.1 response regulator [Pontiellaceae bacterium]